MPNRILKESITTSDQINGLSPEAEVMFYRLLVVCDDYGLMDARSAILRARCFPLRQVTGAKVEQWLKELASAGLICLYKSGGADFLCFPRWDKHQTIRNRRAKYPLPPDGIETTRPHEFPEERDIEDLLFASIDESKTFCGHEVVSVERQVRVRESYLDIVVKSRDITFINEIKRGRLSNKALDQVLKYSAMTSGVPVLIGAGLAVNFDIQKCKENNVAVITYDDHLRFDLALANASVTSCDFTLHHVMSRDAVLAPNPIQSNPIQSESESESNPRGAGKPRFELPDWVPEQQWASFCEMRRKARHPLTDHAKKLILAELDRLRGDGHDPGAVLDQSTANAWRGVFPLKDAPASASDEWAKAAKEVWGDAA